METSLTNWCLADDCDHLIMGIYCRDIPVGGREGVWGGSGDQTHTVCHLHNIKDQPERMRCLAGISELKTLAEISPPHNRMLFSCPNIRFFPWHFPETSSGAWNWARKQLFGLRRVEQSGASKGNIWGLTGMTIHTLNPEPSTPSQNS